MITPIQKQTTATQWALGIGQAGERAARERADETSRVARALDNALETDDRAEILAQFDRAVVLFQKEQRWHEGLTAAQEVYKKVVHWSDFDSTPYARVVAQFAHNYAIELQQARLFQAAEDLYGQALRFFEASDDRARQMISAHQLGRVRQDRGKYAEAEEAYRFSLEIARRLSDHLRIAKNLFQLGQLAQLSGQTETAIRSYREVLALAERIPNEQLLIAAEHQLGILAQTGGRHDEARQRFKTALALAQRSGDARAMADALHQLGVLSHGQGDYARAEEFYRASLARALGSEHPVDVAPTLYQLAQAAFAQADFVAAQTYGRQSLDLFRVQGDLTAIKRVRDWLHRIEFKRAPAASC